ncbi:hypothetical protein QJS10_CPA10g01399 [Acorus calamus]|uniref:Uncharacterized protein n=1 Tax=Acorus calamus TaxID=4465 RepID=A0AAV9E4P2_ACOCL|nr:hypothetical protein QJS10_CPA10g01399 [Acorus calamus]
MPFSSPLSPPSSQILQHRNERGEDMRESVFTWRPIPSFHTNVIDDDGGVRVASAEYVVVATKRRAERAFASVSLADKNDDNDEKMPSGEQLLKHPLVLLALVPRNASLFFAGAIAGVAAKTLTAPLDRVKLIMQTHGLRVAEGSAKKGIGFVEAITLIGKDEGIKGFWKGNLPQVIRIIPYSAAQFFAYEVYKLNLGPEPCVRVKNSLPEKYQKRPETSLATALVSVTLATLMCYPLDTVRRQMQMRGSPYRTVLDAFPGIVARDGVIGLYRGFVPNALKNLPNSSIRLTTFDTVKGLLAASQKELERIIEENREKIVS